MPATPSASGREPGEPLSEQERRALSEIESLTRDEDPVLVARLRRTPPTWVSSRTYNAVMQVAVVFLLAVVVLPGPWAAGLLVLAGMAIPSAIALVALRRGAR